MIRSNTVYSASKALRMKQNKRTVKRVRAGLRDLAYTTLVILILGLIVANIRLDSAITRADVVLASTKVTLADANSKPVGPVINEDIIKTPVQKIKEIAKEDERVIKLREFLRGKNSPLAPYAELIVAEADKYDIGWTKLVSIACIESACGLRLPDGSHNAWGLGGSNFMYFRNWEEGIQYASRLLGTNYKQNENQGIKSKYCPETSGCNPDWAYVVTKTTNDILAMEGQND